jgi:DNA invertase Pin-like site-specific DNA recombinase
MKRPRSAPVESADHWRTILTEQNWAKIRILHDDGRSITMIAVRFGVSRELIWRVSRTTRARSTNAARITTKTSTS